MSNPSDMDNGDEFEEFLGGAFDGGDMDGGAKSKRKKKRGGDEGHSTLKVVSIIFTIIVILMVLVIAYQAIKINSKSFESYAGSGINIGGSCCKTYHTPSLTEIEYPASDGCGTCNSGCNLRYDVSGSSSEGFAVSDLASYNDAQRQAGCCGPAVRVSGCASNQLGPYEMSENVLANTLFTS
jgi:hypothetical protein